MWNWVEQNHGAISALASVLTLIIWTLYFQILLSSYRRTLRAKILINRGAGQHLEAHCLIANMSAEPIYIEAVLVDVGFGGEGKKRWQRCSLSDLDLDVQDRSDPRPQWFQGPLDSSEWIDIGTYRDLIEQTVGRDGAVSAIEQVTITVVATYRAQDTLVAARRSFDIVAERAGDRLSPRDFTAQQIRSRRERRAIERLMREERLDDRSRAVSSISTRKGAG